ncbi:MAG TPA: alpha/beta hydrolase [Thermoleophilaceae bacterium]|jgi:alpha-beta hydrolase superfamily lysophospholipase
MAAKRDEGRLDGAGGLRIHWQAWLPEGDPAAVVALAHGASEHGGRYAWTGEGLTAAGHALYAIDHRGHGRSEGSRAVIDRMDNALADLHQLIGLARSRHPGKLLFLLGHSMGGAVALTYALRHQEELDGLLLSGPVAVLEAASPFTRAASFVLSAVAPRLGVYEIDSTAVSRDPEVVRAYDADPLNYHGKLPARTVAEISAAVGRFPEQVPRLTLPLLVMHGTADRLVPPEGSEMVHDRAGSSDKTIVRYEGLFHEILNEPERDRVLADIVAWLDARARAGAGTAAAPSA